MARMVRSVAGHPHRPPARPARWSRRPVRPADLALIRRELDGLIRLFAGPFHPCPTEDGQSVRSVLIVDDDDFGRETLGLILQADGYQVYQAGSSREALSCLHAQPTPGLILLDVRPGPDGRRFIRRLRGD